MYKVHEIFNSFQGEFPYIGRYSTFIRFYKCNLDCNFCDTMYNKHIISFNEITLDDIIGYVKQTNFITFTGGEPFLFTDDIIDISTEILKRNIYIDKITIETNGSYLYKSEDIEDKFYRFFGSKLPERYSVIWSPKFLDEDLTSTMFTTLYENYLPSHNYIKIVAVPEWEDIIREFLKTAIDLYGSSVKSKLSLMMMTDDKDFVHKSIELALKLAEEFSINITSRLHISLNID